MLKYVLKRIIIAIPVFLGISIVVFAMVQAMPGGPFSQLILDPNISQEYIDRLMDEYGLNDPVPVQYVKWLGRFFRGDLGDSTAYNRPVLDIILGRLPNTILLGLTSLIVSSLIGIPVGVWISTKRGSLADNIATCFCFFGISVPAFFFGMILILLFSMILKVLPTSGMVSAGANYTGWAYALDVFRHMILPTVVLSLLNVASFMRYTRSAMIDVIGQDYIRTAKAKGVSNKDIVMKHAFKNALIPIITIISLQIPGVLSGALLTETIFVWPGIGQLNYQAVQNRDYFLIMGIVMMLAIVTLLVNLIADVLYAVVDPRIRYD